MIEEKTRPRCRWCNLANPLYVRYHDEEWGVPCHDDHALYELLILESFQAGLSWETVLNKRQRFRKVYDGFDLDKVCAYGEEKNAQLLSDEGIIRNRLKIRASIKNSRIFRDIQEEYGSFDSYIWGWTGGKIIHENDPAVTTSPLSDAVSKDLKKRGTVINLLESGSLESKTGWTVSGTGTGSWSYSQAQAYYGRTSLSIQNNTLKPVSSAVRALEPGKTYTFSAYVRAGASGARIGLLKPGSTEPLVVSTAAPANNTWTRLQVTYTLPSGSAYASVLPFLQNTSGTAAYFDALQLEQTASPSRYNLVENSDFSFNSAWTPNSSCASTDQIITYTSSPTENSDKRVMRITGDPNKHKYGNQILDGLSGAAGDVYTVAGWAKGDCVYTDDSNRRMYALMVRFYYTDGTTSDNFIKFNPDTDSQSSWQFVSGVVKATKPYSKMGIYTAYVQTLNTVYFDNVQLFKEEFGHSYDYDSNGNLISVIDLQKNETKYDYDSNNNLVKMTLPSGASQSYTYDSYHNVIKAVSPEGVTSRFTYDTYGNIKTVKLGSGSQTISASAVYTANGDQVSSVTDALGQTTTYGYDTQTGVLNWTQAPGETASTRTNYTHDQLYRTTKVQQSTAAVDYTYSKDLLSAISTASGTDYSFTYGVFDLTTAVKAGSRTLISHSYTNDQNRRLSRSVYGNGDAVSYSYDSFGRTTAVTYGDTGSTVSYAYDANSNLGQLTDGISGRVNRYSYDFLDRLMRYEESGDGYSNIVQWGYDDKNHLSSQTQTLNGTTYTSTYAYDKDNRLTKATEGAISANYAYDSFSRMTGLTAKNGSTSVVSTAVTYVDPSSSATSTQVKTWNNGKTTYTYSYNSKGNISYISDGSLELDYRYDGYGRLTSVECLSSGYTLLYHYDVGGNLTRREKIDPNQDRPRSTIATYTYGNTDWPDLLTAYNGKSITYDAIGNPLNDGTWTYAWQHSRQLASMSKSGSSITYGYNADGKRISKTVNGTTYNYAYLGDTLTDLSWGSNRMHFTYDSLGPASVTYNGNRYFYLKNAQGDVTGLVNASGTQVVSYTYDPWGAPMSVSGSMSATLGAANPLRYRGYVYDTETGFYYLTSRYYNPVWGRFINADGYASTGQGFTGDNMFAYCNDNPVNYKDSEGTEPELAMGWAASMSWLPAIDGPVPVGDTIYILIFLALCVPYFSKNESKLPNQGPVSEIPDAPPVDSGKQGKHVPGHPNNNPSKSQWEEGETGVRETQEAWQNGTEVKPDGSVRVGTASDGRKVKVHRDESGRIHGYPVPQPR